MHYRSNKAYRTQSIFMLCFVFCIILAKASVVHQSVSIGYIANGLPVIAGIIAVIYVGTVSYGSDHKS